MEVVEGFLDTHIDMFVTYTSVEAVEDFLDIHIHHFKIIKSLEVVEAFFRTYTDMDTHIYMFVTYTSVEDFLDIHIHHLKSSNLWRLWRPFLEHIQTWTGYRNLFCYLHICGGCGGLFRYTHTPL